MNELAILYDKVCAANPAAVVRSKWGELVCQWNGETLTGGADDIEHRKVRFWCWANGMSRHWRSEEEAEAIILKHWVGMLPPQVCLMKSEWPAEIMHEKPDDVFASGYCIVLVPQAFDSPFQVVVKHNRATAVEALAAYLLDGGLM